MWSFDVTFEQLVNVSPGLRDKMVAGPQPGSPVVTQVGERLKKDGPLNILRSTTEKGGIWLAGDGWLLTASRGWRVLNTDRTLAFTWFTPGVEANVADLVDVAVTEIIPQSSVSACDPALRLSDGRWLEIFTADPLTPWFIRLPSGEFTGAPTAPEWL